jgi:hypothetical protein
MWRTAASRYRRTVNAAGVFDPSRLFTLRTRLDFRRTVAYGLTALAALIAGHEGVSAAQDGATLATVVAGAEAGSGSGAGDESRHDERKNPGN